jgi:hypothetical protein
MYLPTSISYSENNLKNKQLQSPEQIFMYLPTSISYSEKNLKNKQHQSPEQIFMYLPTSISYFEKDLWQHDSLLAAAIQNPG